MKLDFLSIGGGGGGGSDGVHRFDLFAPRAADPPPLDDARHIIRTGLIVAGLFFGLLILVSIVAPISGAAVANGEVTTSGTTIVVQPENGGVVGEVFVHEGQHVRAGQPLVRLNGVKSVAAAEQAQARHDALRALQARLIAERDGLSAIAFPPDFTARADDPDVRGAIAAQLALFRRHGEVLGTDRRIAATDSDAARAQRTGNARQLALIQDELGSIQKLYDKGYARLSELRALQRSAADLQAQTATATSAAEKSRLQQVKLADQQVMDTVSQLQATNEQLAQVDPALRVTRYDADRDLLRAQVAGRVSGLAAIGPGTVLGSGSTAMQIVPDGRALIVEAIIKPGDIDDVHLGSPATLRFTTINPRGQSSIQGRVVALSPARVPGANGAAGYRAQIAVVDAATLRRAHLTLQPGEPVVVQVRTHSRSLLGYLFGPLQDASAGAFREN